MSMTLFVGNIPYALMDEPFFELFSPFGEVLMSRIVRNRDTGESKGYGFVEFAEADDAQRAKGALDGMGVMGRRISVSFAEKKDRKVDRYAHVL